ncbi:MAG: hypothetical protein EKK49_11390 [Rhodocyclaceae bacterium]|nr:MAG: hypothetical protein EKK49_11390 [Rhodocyclaceae bacterium]
MVKTVHAAAAAGLGVALPAIPNGIVWKIIVVLLTTQRIESS